MAKWKFFSKNKKEKESETKKDEEIIEIDVESNKDEQETKEQTNENKEDDLSITKYKETIYSTEVSQDKKEQKPSTQPKDQHLWRDVDSIEKNVDKLHIKKAQEPVDDLDKKVDGLIQKTKKKHRKPSNVIYVVSKPQPGEVRGDWAVRGHSKIYSHHKTKEKAIEEARKIARKRDATVLVQNTDGTFSDGFKPRKK